MNLNLLNVSKMKFIVFLIVLYFFNLSIMDAQSNKNAEIVTLQFSENGNFPNNPELPVLLYKAVFDFEDGDPAAQIENILSENNWKNSWRNGIFNYHHYHTTAHEALGVYGGWAEVQLGGPGSKTVRIEKGDLVVLPVGTAHKRIDSGDGFAVVGAYPDGQNYDMNYGKEEELEKARDNIAKLPLPNNDPVFGSSGKITEYWR